MENNNLFDSKIIPVTKNTCIIQNEFNSLFLLTGMTASQLDVFFLICAQLRDEKSTVASLSAAEIRNYCKLKNLNSHERMEDFVLALAHSLRNIRLINNDEDTLSITYFFKQFTYSKRTGLLTVHVDDYFDDYIRGNGTYTKLEMKQYIQLKSKYTKHLYRLLKQFDNKSSSWRRIKIDDLRLQMDCPSSYVNKHFIEKVLKKSVAELNCKNIFQNLVYEVEKEGGKALRIFFRWTSHKKIYVPDKKPITTNAVVKITANEYYDRSKKQNKPSKYYAPCGSDYDHKSNEELEAMLGII